MKIGIVGLGKMGEAIIEGLRRPVPGEPSTVFEIKATTRSEESAAEAGKKLGIDCTTDNARLAKESEILIVCVKPHQAKGAIEGMRANLSSDKLVITICAAITTGQAEEWSGGKAPVIRAMPNTPALIGAGMTVYAGGKLARSEHHAIAERIFGTVGQTAQVEEHLMDGVTGLSGCGPAYIYLIIEALSEAGVKVGLPRKTATLLAAQTMMGSAKMVLERGEHPAALKDEVTTPAGCTIDGLMALEEGALRVTLIKAVLAATERSKTLRG